MKVLRGIQKAAMVSAIAVMAMGAAQAYAADNVADVGHASVSVASALSITERTALRFGNIIVSFTGGANAGDATLTMSPTGARSTASGGQDTITLYNGANNTVPGGDDAGSQSPGFYDISGLPNTDVYVSFSVNGGGALIDANHPTNHIVLTGPAGSDTFFVNQFTFDKTDGAADTSPGNTSTASANDYYGNHITTNSSGLATVRVGATLSTDGGANATYADGTYRGTFDIMASY